jgi:hypothetical protein
MEFSTWVNLCGSFIGGMITFVGYWVGYHIGYGRCKQDILEEAEAKKEIDTEVKDLKKILTDENKSLTTE